jgi:hypothetical protein
LECEQQSSGPLREMPTVAIFPFQESGNGIQFVYLTQLPPAITDVLIGLIGKEASLLSQRSIESVQFSPQLNDLGRFVLGRNLAFPCSDHRLLHE